MFTKTPTALPSWYVCLNVFLLHCLNICTSVQDAATRRWKSEAMLHRLNELLLKTSLTPPVCNLISARCVYFSRFVDIMFHLLGVADWNPTVHLLSVSSCKVATVRLTELCKWNCVKGVVAQEQRQLCPGALLLRSCWGETPDLVLLISQDLLLTFAFAFLWLTSSSAWAKGLSDVKTATNPATILTFLSICKDINNKCTPGAVPLMGRLNASVVRRL